MPSRQPSFRGNSDDLSQFERLVASRRRSEERELALRDWERYKLARQAAYVQDSKNKRARTSAFTKRGVWTKGDYVKSLTTPAIDLSGATFKDLCVGYVDLRGVRLDDASFLLDQMAWCAMKGAKLVRASLVGAKMPFMRLMEADLRGAVLDGADLRNADLTSANLGSASLRGAHLTGSILEMANLVGADVEGAELGGSRVYGLSAWDLRGRPASSLDLVVTPAGAPAVTADDLRVAQFLYLLMNNPNIRDVLDTVTRKVVLILGRFTEQRKKVLDALRAALRTRGLVPVLFDFGKPGDRDVTETVTLLARIARFVVADLTDPASIPQELQAIAPDVVVPIRLIIAAGQTPYSMSSDLRKYHWVLPPYRYTNETELLANLQREVIDVAEAKRIEIERARADANW